jgi:hypothetical protein
LHEIGQLIDEDGMRLSGGVGSTPNRHRLVKPVSWRCSKLGC